MKQNRFKSRVVWTAIIAQIISICQLAGIFEKIGIDAGIVGDVAAAVLQLCVVVGILNNPTDAQNF